MIKKTQIIENKVREKRKEKEKKGENKRSKRN